MVNGGKHKHPDPCAMFQEVVVTEGLQNVNNKLCYGRMTFGQPPDYIHSHLKTSHRPIDVIVQNEWLAGLRFLDSYRIRDVSPSSKMDAPVLLYNTEESKIT